MNQPGKRRVALPSSALSLFLPFEIVRQIGESLKANPKALRVSSLTCRAWHSAIRPWIFYCITINRLNVDDLEEVFGSIPSLPFWIKEIRICGVPLSSQKRRLADSQSTTTDSGDWYAKLPSILEGNLKLVHTFTFVEIDTTGQPQPKNLLSLFSLLNSFPTMTSINVQSCQFAGSQMESIIRAILVPQLKNLHIHGNSIVVDEWLPMPSSALDSIRPQLSSLRIHSIGNGVRRHSYRITDALLKAYDNLLPDSISTFHLHINLPFKLDRAALLVNKLGARVQNLNLSLPSQFETYASHWHIFATEGIHQCFDLSLMSNLRKLHLHDVDHPAAPHLLSTIKASQLNTIVFSISGSRDFKARSYAEVDERLHQPVFASLQRALFVYCGPSRHLESITQQLKELMPLLAKRNIIEVRIEQIEDCCPENGDVL